MQLTQGTAEIIMSDLGMEDVPLMEHTPIPTALPNDWFTRYKELCHKFTMSLMDSVQELAFMNLPQNEFMDLLMGRSIPANLSFRFRVPPTWGGKFEIDNMFICWTFPQSQRMDRFLIMQSDAKTVWLPNPAKKIYLPAHTAGGGDGGNATEDRLAQMSAQLASGRE